MTYTESHDSAARVAAPGAPVAPPPPSAKNGASPNKGAPQRPKTPAGGKTKAARKNKSKAKADSAKPAAALQTQSKGAQILAMIERSKGATLAEIQKTTGWQPHYADVRIMPTCVSNPVCGAVIAAMESA